jgi:hypothetical protein
MRWVGYVARIGERNAYNISVGKTEAKKPFGRPKGRMYLREIGWEIVNWMHLAQDMDQWQALVTTVMNIGVS